MTLPVREQVMAALTTRLATLDGVTVERARDVPVARYPALVVSSSGHTVLRQGPGINEYALAALVDGLVSGRDAAACATAANLLYARVVACLEADPTLGGVAVDIREDSMDEDAGGEDASRPVAAFTLSLTIQYQTVAGDPYSLG